MELNKKIITTLVIYGIFLLSIVLFLEKAINFDEYIFFAINSIESSQLLFFFNLITYLGSSMFWILLIILFWLKKKKDLSLRLLIVFIIDTIALTILKVIFFRPRPSQTVINFFDFDSGFSFPSGHSERAFSGAVILSNYYKKYSLLFYILAVLVAFSRIYIGVHYPLDVVIGSVNGIIFSMLVLSIPIKKYKSFFSSQKLSQLLHYKS